MSTRAVVVEASDTDLDAVRQHVPAEVARFGGARPLTHQGGGLNAPVGGISPGEVIQTVTAVLGAAKSLFDLAKAVLEVLKARREGRATLRDAEDPARVLVVITASSSEDDLRRALAVP